MKSIKPLLRVGLAAGFAVGMVGMTPLLLFGPALFALIFGEPWRMAGAIVQCLIPVQLARFVVIPIAQALNIYGRQDLHLAAAALGLAATAAAFALGAWLVVDPANLPLYWLLTGVAAIVGVLLTISIGGADMPVAIALLNSYSGIAGAATGFVINNSVLIVAGSLVGASGIILTQIMCKAMNRSMVNVLFGVLGPTSETPSADETYKTVKATSADEIAMMLDGAQRVGVCRQTQGRSGAGEFDDDRPGVGGRDASDAELGIEAMDEEGAWRPGGAASCHVPGAVLRTTPMSPPGAGSLVTEMPNCASMAFRTDVAIRSGSSSRGSESTTS